MSQLSAEEKAELLATSRSEKMRSDMRQLRYKEEIKAPYASSPTE